MKRCNYLVAATVIVSWAAVLSGQSLAQEGAATTTGSGLIVVLDVAKVFKENASFNKKIEAIQAKAKTLKSEVEGKQQQLQTAARDVSEKYAATSPERKTAEAELEQQLTTLRTYARQSEAELMSEEAEVYFQTYQAMHSIVSRAAAANNISMVLRFDSSECDQSNRGDVIKMVNRAIIFQSNSDITDYVVTEMAKIETAAAGTGGAR